MYKHYFIYYSYFLNHNIKIQSNKTYEYNSYNGTAANPYFKAYKIKILKTSQNCLVNVFDPLNERLGNDCM